MAIVSNYDNKRRNLATTTYTGATLNGTGKTTNYGDGKFANKITPTTQTYFTGATLDGSGTMQNAGNGTFATKLDPTPTNINSGSGVVAQAAAPAVADPYSSIYSLYESQLNAQRNALEQQRQARLNALQANYNNAKSQLDSSFNQGETELNQNADEALRQAYVSNLLNQKNMNQYLNGQGITGGAAESILANLYNTYGNNRNDIERGRADNLRQLLANYQGTLGDIENSYLTGMADADSDYSGAIANALTNYYSGLADMQKQNIANQYKTVLGKTGTSSSKSATTADTTADKRIANVLKSAAYKGDYAKSKAYLDAIGMPEDEQFDYLLDAGYVDELMGSGAQTPSTASRASLANVSPEVVGRLLSYLDNNRGQVYGNDINKLLAALQTYGQQYGLTEEQMRAILAEAGY